MLRTVGKQPERNVEDLMSMNDLHGCRCVWGYDGIFLPRIPGNEKFLSARKEGIRVA